MMVRMPLFARLQRMTVILAQRVGADHLRPEAVSVRPHGHVVLIYRPWLVTVIRLHAETTWNLVFGAGCTVVRAALVPWAEVSILWGRPVHCSVRTWAARSRPLGHCAR